ncbi:MAG: SWIM zinc finger family protein [Candidatus Latescibacterota bacterium]
MTTTEVQKKNEHLNVIQFEDKIFYVDSADGRILYKVLLMDDEKKTLYCTCPDFTKSIKTNPDYQCDHIAAVLSGNHRREVAARKRPKLAEEFIKQIDGKDFVIYAGLLDLAHQRGLQRLEVELVQFPGKDNENFAICKATAVSRNGEMFVDFGDANTSNCNPKVAKHLVRMASTRAKARALRDFTNIGITCLEELGDLNEVIGEESNASPRKTVYERPKAKAVFEPASKAEAAFHSAPEAGARPGRARSSDSDPTPETDVRPEGARASDSVPVMSDAQRRAILNLSKRRGIDDGQVEKLAKDHFGTRFDALSIRDASAFIRILQQTA